MLPPQPLQQPHGHTTKTGAATPRRRPYDEIVRRKNGVPVEVRLCRHACTGILAHACLCRRVCACAATVAATVAAPAVATVAPPTRAYDEKATSMRRNRTTKKNDAHATKLNDEMFSAREKKKSMRRIQTTNFDDEICCFILLRRFVVFENFVASGRGARRQGGHFGGTPWADT